MPRSAKSKSSHATNQENDPGSARKIYYKGKDIPPFEIIKGELDEVRDFIDENLSAGSANEAVNKVLSEFRFGTGKMVRPAVLILSYLASRQRTSQKGIRNNAGDCDREVIRLAAMVEIIHNATLIHDDVIDQAKSRRSMPTINALRGNESAVLFGDFLLSRVFSISAGLEPEIIKIISEAASRTCEGEIAQMAQAKNWMLSEKQYIRIISDKTGALFRCCCLLGSVLGGAEPAVTKSLIKYGENAGIAFQITDDLLDITGSTTKTGKSPGSDLDNNKLTLPLIHLLRESNERIKSDVKRQLTEGTINRESILKLLESTGSIRYSREQARRYVTNALNSLVNLKQSRERGALIQTAGYIAARAG